MTLGWGVVESVDIVGECKSGGLGTAAATSNAYKVTVSAFGGSAVSISISLEWLHLQR